MEDRQWQVIFDVACKANDQQHANLIFGRVQQAIINAMRDEEGWTMMHGDPIEITDEDVQPA